VIDDFAHHPTAIAATLRALRGRYVVGNPVGNPESKPESKAGRKPGRRIWAILEPRSNTLRRNVFQHELVESLMLADQVVIASVFFKTTDTLKPEERLDVDWVVAELNARKVAARQLPDVAAIVSEVVPELVPGDVVAILSNGGFGGIYEKLPEALQRRAR